MEGGGRKKNGDRKIKGKNSPTDTSSPDGGNRGWGLVLSNGEGAVRENGIRNWSGGKSHIHIPLKIRGMGQLFKVLEDMDVSQLELKIL